MSYFKKMKLILYILPLISLLAISCKVNDADSDPSGNPVNVAIVDIDASNLFGNACTVGDVEIETEAVPDQTEIEIDVDDSDVCLVNDDDVVVDDGVALAQFVADYVTASGSLMDIEGAFEIFQIQISILLDNGTMFEQFANIPVSAIGIATPDPNTIDVEAAAEDDSDMAAPTPVVFQTVGLAGKLNSLVASVSNDTLGMIDNVVILANGDIFVEYQPNNGTEGTNIITVTGTLVTPPAFQAMCPPGTIGDGEVVTAFITINQTAADPEMMDMDMMETNCGDSIDDDGDMMIDCFDPDCAMDPICEIGGPETMCADTVDNDADMATDCLDEDCEMNDDCETGNAECTGGMDEDMDGLVDCEDPGCNSFDGENGDGTGANCEIPDEMTCDDMFDNDADGMADCADPDNCPDLGNDLANECDDENTMAECMDNFDNDGDGDIDCADMDMNDCNESGNAIAPCENDNETLCGDGIDNDGMDGTDCADAADCPDQMNDTAGECNAENTVNTCDDMFDNDGDTLVDCADPDCDTIACEDLVAGGFCNIATEMCE